MSFKSRIAEAFRRLGNVAYTVAERMDPTPPEEELERPEEPTSLGSVNAFGSAFPVVELSPKAREMVETGLHPPPHPQSTVGDRSPTATPESPPVPLKPAAGTRTRSWRG